MNIRRSLFSFVATVALGWLIPLGALAEGVTLVPAGAVWRYNDHGTNLGTVWMQPAYDDSRWASGRAQLGYGEGDEATIVNSGPPGGHFITTYFRYAFVVTNASTYTNLTLRLLRDDGAVVYLNGFEMARVGMPAGQITYQTLAANPLTVEGSLFVTPILNPGILLDGVNVLAVEIHQISASSSDISFDLELVNGEPTALASFVDLATNAVFAAPARLSLAAKAATQGGVTNVALYVNNTRVDQRPMLSRLYAVFNRDLTTASNYTLAISAHDYRGFSKTSVVDIVIDSPPVQRAVLVNTNEAWKYLDDGSDPGVAWRAPGYNDEGWSAGPAALGYGKTGLATTVRSNRVSDGSRITTTYFRRAWDVADPAQFRKLVLRVLRDDAAKVYLNGVKVFHDNLPSDPVATSTLALETTDATNFISGAYVDASLLVTGRNVLAVEVHQASAGPADLVFDLELAGLSDPPPKLAIQLAAPDALVLSWPYPATGYRLISAAEVTATEWPEVTNAAVRVGNDLQVTLPPPSASRYYRLRKTN